MIERDFDVPFVADLALREKQIQQNYRPIIAVHKWFARRPGTLFRAILLSEFSKQPLREAFYSANHLPTVRVLDPFMGGGTTLIEANRIGCQITGFDINPMSYWIVREEIESLDLQEYELAAQRLRKELEQKLGKLYRTRCLECGSSDADVKYFLWVKTLECEKCHRSIDLFPNHLLAEDVRHPKNVFVCWSCGSLNESSSREPSEPCRSCGEHPRRDLGARRGSVMCRDCGTRNTFPRGRLLAPQHRLFALEYNCRKCRPSHMGRFFKQADAEDLARFAAADVALAKVEPRFVPEEEIPPGDETDRLHRWGYHQYRELFNARQLLGLEISCELIDEVVDAKTRRALATNLSDLLRYQNMLCRYDTMALKSLDIFSVHGFPVGQIQCESNLLGISGDRTKSNVGSGGWLNMTEKFIKAKTYCERPFEMRHVGKCKEQVFIRGEWIGEVRNGVVPQERRFVSLSCDDATTSNLGRASFDAVLTDPPYFGNVQYAELMDFCYVWLRKLTKGFEPAFSRTTTRTQNELTGNASMGRNLADFAEGLSQAFRKAAHALKPGGPFVFTYHHNQLESYLPVGVAILDARLTCSASLPCPAEMGASIHINGTGSSILDTVFVCRSTGKFPRRWLARDAKALAGLVSAEVEMLRQAHLEPSQGDIRCLVFGHLVRLAVWNLRGGWSTGGLASERIRKVSQWIQGFGGPEHVIQNLGRSFALASRVQQWQLQETKAEKNTRRDEISF